MIYFSVVCTSHKKNQPILKKKYLMNWKKIWLFIHQKENVIILSDFNARTDNCDDFISKDGNQFIKDISEN